MIKSEQMVEKEGDGMELFEPILGMTMIVVGLVMLFGSIGLLLYGIWTSGKSKPDASTHVSVGASDNQAEVGQA